MNASNHIRFARALKQIRNAAENLSDVTASTGDRRGVPASQLLSQLANALQYGGCYPVESHAKAFDDNNPHDLES